MLAIPALVIALGMVPFAPPRFWGVASGFGYEASGGGSVARHGGGSAVVGGADGAQGGLVVTDGGTCRL